MGSGPPPALPHFSEQLADVPFGVGLAQAIVNVGIDVKKTHGLVTPPVPPRHHQPAEPIHV